MVNRRTALAACVGLLGALVTAASLRAQTANHLQYLTFSGAVALPGVTLAAGSYSFEIADPNGTNSVVLVRDRASRKAMFMGLTNRIERPRGVEAGHVVLGEARRGEVPPIVAWYAPDEDTGRQFIYR